MSSARVIMAERAMLLVLDAECPLCRRAAHFVLRHARAPVYLASLHEASARRLGEHFGADPGQLDSVWLVRAGDLHRDSAALWRLAQGLRWPWRGLAALRWLPHGWRDGVYHVVGRWRHRLAPATDWSQQVGPHWVSRLDEVTCRRLGLPLALVDDNSGPADTPQGE
ncbi:thiol-disulfide oxidoreductase DCC family protein [Chromohalobacter canadensis]|uniref:DUF393 domain-containing protein n=1 Tax=Chromohalobacter canadensis TaxID=141389 RepID=A0ABZ0YG02_9GAMM|nr:DUF393 domain-containing protein [Chromohalobacter canadensis]MCK0770233.1 DUF393 domain-containing protein [Chromohalobacter canadensis]WQH10489.1 DUF393 domain-containing protein [Chromohalobacter canadensis]